MAALLFTVFAPLAEGPAVPFFTAEKEATLKDLIASSETPAAFSCVASSVFKLVVSAVSAEAFASIAAI